MVDERKKIKVLRIIARLNIGGPAVHTILLQEGLNRERFSSHLLCGRHEPGEGDMSYLAAEKQIKLNIIPELRRSINPWHDLVSLVKIVSIVRKTRPDIIHTHTAKAGALGRLAARLLGVPVVLHTFHGHIFEGYFGPFKTRIFLAIERFLARQTDYIITVSERLRQTLTGEYKIAAPDKVRVVKLGFELDNFLSIPEPDRREGVKVGIVGRLVPVKNHHFFLTAVKRLKGLRPDLPVKFLIIGDGGLRDNLEGKVKELRLEKEVEFLGWQKDLTAVYGDLDIVALTSDNEGTPVSLIEAMASARPVIATNVGGVADIVEEGRNGYLIERGDTDIFARRLIELAESPDLRKELGRYGRETVREQFSKDRLVGDMEELYLELINAKRITRNA